MSAGSETTTSSIDPTLKDKFLGCLVGLAVVDALGTTVEFKIPGTFTPITKMQGGGAHKLKPGEYTDDTAMALCLAESIVTKKSFDLVDQLKLYSKWYHQGFMSSNGKCFDIGNAVRSALGRFSSSGHKAKECGDPSRKKAGNGSLMRLAPVPMYYCFASVEELVLRCAESSKTTHSAPQSVDACKYYGAAIQGALRGKSKEELLSPLFSMEEGFWSKKGNELDTEVADVVKGCTFKTKNPPEIVAAGYVVKSLEAALWAFFKSTDFKSGALLAVNLGHDADTVGAIYGMLAGAYYGYSNIPEDWRKTLVKREIIEKKALALLDLALKNVK